MSLDELIDSAPITGLTIWRLSDGRYQVNVRWVDSEGWSIRYAESPAAGLKAALDDQVLSFL